ncbi:MAG: hypothetical protein JNL66_15700 [Alphaproteobacteria bacterium]|nr:hypothetical protein [Alphaproteobacteria bacterium]
MADPIDAIEGPGDAMTAIAAPDGGRAAVVRVDLEGTVLWRAELALAGDAGRRETPPRLVLARDGGILVVSGLAVIRLGRDGAPGWRADGAALGMHRIDSAVELADGAWAVGGSGSPRAACNRAPTTCDDLQAMVAKLAANGTVSWRHWHDAGAPARRGAAAVEAQALGPFGRGGVLAFAHPAPDAAHGHARLLWLDERGRLARNAPVEIRAHRAGAAFDRDLVVQRRGDGVLVVSSLAPPETARGAAAIRIQTIGSDGRRRGDREVRIATRFADGTACAVADGAREIGAGFMLQALTCRAGTAGAERTAFVLLRFTEPAGAAGAVWLDESERPLRVSADGRVVLAFAGGRIVRLALPGEQP